MFKRVIILIIDACGVGELPDAANYGDVGSSTLPNIARAVGGLNMPNCQKLGLGNITEIEGIPRTEKPLAAVGKMTEKSPGKDSTTGHWEIGGVILNQAFPVFPEGFPLELVTKFENKVGVSTLGNCTASGTEIIKQLGDEHIKTGKLILYTSADSVFQLAAHEDVIPIEHQYEICQIARDMLVDDYAVGRVIARPFVGESGNYKRTSRRRDFSLLPQSETILDAMIRAGHKTLSIGKIYDLFAGQGISTAIKTTSNDDGMDQIITALRTDIEHKLIFANLVDFDQLWGHRNDEKNFALALEKFDGRATDLLQNLKHDDLLIITADHGCDPTIKSSTDHSREYVPLICYSPNESFCPSELGVRETFADVACTITENFGLSNKFPGQSFLAQLKEQ